MWVTTERSYRLTQTPFKSAKNLIDVAATLEIMRTNLSKQHSAPY